MNLLLRVPATTSNMGPGFDCFGMALSLHLEVEARPAPELKVTSEGAVVPLDRSNLIVRTMLDALGHEPKLHLHLRNRIPLARGLGSSAAARVAGLALAACVKDGPEKLDKEALGRAATALEHHPDNAMPCVHGGFCVSGPDAFERIEPLPRPMLFAVPALEIHTEAARAALPKTISLADAVFNLQHAALGVARLARTRDLASLAPFADRLHQRHRLALSVPLQRAYAYTAQHPSVEAQFLSGSGPTVFVLPRDAAAARAALLEAFDEEGVAVEVLTLTPDTAGLTVAALP
jgi:homoserine kinase